MQGGRVVRVDLGVIIVAVAGVGAIAGTVRGRGGLVVIVIAILDVVLLVVSGEEFAAG